MGRNFDQSRLKSRGYSTFRNSLTLAGEIGGLFSVALGVAAAKGAHLVFNLVMPNTTKDREPRANATSMPA